MGNLVSSAGIRTGDVLVTSLHPKPHDQGFRPSNFAPKID